MTKGKHATRAANGRAEQLAEEVLQLRQQLAEAKDAHVRERAELKAEVQRLSNRLTTEVDSLSRDAIRVFQASAQAEMNEAREALIAQHKENRVAAVTELLTSFASHQLVTVALIEKIGKMLGMNGTEIGPLLNANNRNARRSTWSKVQRVVEHERRGGRPIR